MSWVRNPRHFLLVDKYQNFTSSIVFMDIKEIVENKFHGLPGLGVNGLPGEQGIKGQSIYIGYLRSFFDGVYLTEREKGYIRVKGEEEQLDSAQPDYYYRSDGNFYRKIEGVDGTMEQMLKFTIYNLKGVYYQNTPTNTLKSETWKSLGTNDEKFLNRKANIGDALDYRYAIGKREGIPDIAFEVRLSEDYLSARDYNNSRTNYSNTLTPDIFVPISLKKMYHEGDILYIQDDITGDIACFIVLTKEMEQCSFEQFLKYELITLEMMTSTFKNLNGRGIINKKTYMPILELNQVWNKINQERMYFHRNFVSEHKNDYNFSIMYNDDESKPFLKLVAGRAQDYEILQTSDGEDLTDNLNRIFEVLLSESDKEKFFTFDYQKEIDEETGLEDSFVFKGENLKFSNLFIKNIDTNLNVKEYNNSNIVFVDDFHVAPVYSNSIETDDVSISMSIQKNNYLKTSTSSHFYGLEVFKYDGDGFVSVFKKESGEDNAILYNLNVSECEEGVNQFGIASYVKGYGISTYWSYMSELDVYCSKNENGELFIDKTTYKQNDFEEKLNSFDSGMFEFFTTNLTAEKTDNFELRIESVEGVKIQDVYINNVSIIEKGTISSVDKLGTWLQITDESECEIADDLSSISFTKLFVESNIPDIKDEGVTRYPETMKEYLSIISRNLDVYQIGQSLNKTIDRDVVVTVIGENEIGAKYRSSYIITQSGVENVLPDVSVSFSNLILDSQIEDSNKSDNGILCNQFQYFVNMNVHNFNENTWGRFLDQPKMSLLLELDKNVYSQGEDYYYIKDTNLTNVQIYAQNDKDLFVNNAAKVQFTWLKDGNYKSSVKDLIGKEHVLEYKTCLSNEKNTEIPNQDGWVYFGKDQFNRNGTTIPYGVNYEITSLVENLDYDDKIKLRTVCEVSNPIPMEFNFKWKVKEIYISGVLRDEYDSNGDELVFKKDLSDTNVYSENKLISENAKFIINPVSVTLCPEDIESSQMSDIRGSIKKVGSEECAKISLEIQDIDFESVEEFGTKNFYDIHARQEYLSNFRRGLGFGVSDITYYRPKIKYLQDNITNLTIKSKKVDFEVGEYGEMIQEMTKYDSVFRNTYNIFLPSGNDYPKYIDIFYDAAKMLPQNRGGVNNFYYNDKLYESENYSQWGLGSPLWTEFEFVCPVVDSSLLSSKQVWNIEYEVSKEYQENLITGGIITKSGNGYLYLNDEYDTGQYDVDKLYRLQETKDLCESMIVSEPTVRDLMEPTGFLHQPKTKTFFRPLLKNSEWVYPNYIKNDDSVQIYPYYLTNSYTSYLDAQIMKGVVQELENDNEIDFENYIESQKGELFVDDESYWEYCNRKVEKEFYISTGNGPELTSSMEKINMFIPYNRMFDIYPRTCYNTDMGANVVNVFMLQQPNVNRRGNYQFDKTYFEDDHLSLIGPWKFNK